MVRRRRRGKEEANEKHAIVQKLQILFGYVGNRKELTTIIKRLEVKKQKREKIGRIKEKRKCSQDIIESQSCTHTIHTDMHEEFCSFRTFKKVCLKLRDAYFVFFFFLLFYFSDRMGSFAFSDLKRLSSWYVSFFYTASKVEVKGAEKRYKTWVKMMKISLLLNVFVLNVCICLERRKVSTKM